MSESTLMMRKVERRPTVSSESTEADATPDIPKKDSGSRTKSSSKASDESSSTTIVVAIVFTLLLGLSYWLVIGRDSDPTAGLVDPKNRVGPDPIIIQAWPVAPLKSGSANVGVLIAEQNWVPIRSANPSEGFQMHYRTSGSGSPKFVFIHAGEDRNDASRHWDFLQYEMSEIGTFFALDLIQYGNSVPGAAEKKKRHIPLQEHADHVSQFLNAIHVPDVDYEDEDRTFVVIARSWTCSVLLESLKMDSSKVRGLVLIAPVIEDSVLTKLPKELTNLPILLVFSVDDEKSSVSVIGDRLIKLFRYSNVANFDDPLPAGIDRSLAHKIELLKPKEFLENFKDFIMGL